MVERRVNRYPNRGKYDTETLNSIVDNNIICHVAFSDGSDQYNIPMICARRGEILYTHSSIKGRLYKLLGSGTPVCITLTEVNGIVLARSAFNSSLNYRSAMIFGSMSEITDHSEKMLVMESIVEKIVNGRWNDCRKPSQSEIDATAILGIRMNEFSCKVREGPPSDNPEDAELPYWAGVINLSTRKVIEQTGGEKSGEIPLPGYIEKFVRDETWM